VQIELARIVAARPHAVFATVADVETWPQILRSVRSVELLTPGSIRVGTRLREQRVMFGRETTEEVEVIEIERTRRLRLAGEDLNIRYELDHVIDALAAGGSRLMLIFRIRPEDETDRAVVPFVAPFAQITLRDELEQDLADLAAAARARSVAAHVRETRQD
jgi:hypothetical protein